MVLRLEDLPFPRREPVALLGIDRGRTAPDLSGDYTGYGHAVVDEIVLADANGRHAIVRDALVLAIHGPDLDDPNAKPDELELEFLVRDPSDPDAEPIWVFVSASRFLDARATEVIGDARDVVLALCNPRDLRPSPPRWLVGDRRLHIATGDVVSWLDIDGRGGERLRLHAHAWHTMTSDR